jgi:hypothetical protein
MSALTPTQQAPPQYLTHEPYFDGETWRCMVKTPMGPMLCIALGSTSDEAKQTAENITRACNSHLGLGAVLERLTNTVYGQIVANPACTIPAEELLTLKAALREAGDALDEDRVTRLILFPRRLNGLRQDPAAKEA